MVCSQIQGNQTIGLQQASMHAPRFGTQSNQSSKQPF